MLGRIVFAALLLAGARAEAGVKEKETQALRAAFPGADSIVPRDVLLSDEMVRRLESLARTKVRERMVTFYTASAGKQVVGYAVIHSHVVRTKRETFTLALEPDGRIRDLTVISFLEPIEYLPSQTWLQQFRGKTARDRLVVGDDISAITGATLTARGIAAESRWLLQALRLAQEAR